MSGGEWNTTRERKQSAADAREQEREALRLEKRMLRDLRWTAERSRLRESDWHDLVSLMHSHGKEGPSPAMAGTDPLLEPVPTPQRWGALP
jgi:hypothetical protein